MMDEITERALESFKESLGRIEAILDRLLTREEVRVAKMTEYEIDMIRHCEQCAAHRNGFMRDIEVIKTDINNIRALPDKKKQNWQLLAFWITSLIGWVAFMLQLFKVIK